MKIEFTDDNLVIHGIKNFNLTDIFDCGQCFRFDRLDDITYIGTAFGKTVRVSQENDKIILHNTTEDDFKTIWVDFFDLNRDYSAIINTLTSSDDVVIREAISYGSGIRILKQDLWETMISFIISASNNIPRIKKIIDLLCTNFGETHTYEGNVYYSFPSPDRIAQLGADELSVIRAGFREKYILKCAKMVCNGEFDLDGLRHLSTAEAKKKLMSLPGIGNKVSDCILLFALNRFDSFPIDVWIKRIMEYCYFNSKEQSIDTIARFAADKFGNLGGIAQQYLFYYARGLKIGT